MMRSRLARMVLFVGGLALFLWAAQECPAQPTPQRSLLALSKRNHTLAIVDPATLQVIARTPGGQTVERDIPISVR